MWSLYSLLAFTQNSTDSSTNGGGVGVALFSSPTSDWKSQENIRLGYNFKVQWNFTALYTNPPDKLTLELEVPFTSPIQYNIITDKIGKGVLSYNWNVSSDLTPNKGYRLLLRRSQNPGETRQATLTAAFGQLTPSYSPHFTLYVSKDFSPNPATEAISAGLDWIPSLLLIFWV